MWRLIVDMVLQVKPGDLWATEEGASTRGNYSLTDLSWYNELWVRIIRGLSVICFTISQCDNLAQSQQLFKTTMSTPQMRWTTGGSRMTAAVETEGIVRWVLGWQKLCSASRVRMWANDIILDQRIVVGASVWGTSAPWAARVVSGDCFRMSVHPMWFHS